MIQPLSSIPLKEHKPFSLSQNDHIIINIAKGIFFPDGRHANDLLRSTLLRNLKGEIHLVSSDNKHFYASAYLLQGIAKVTFFFVAWADKEFVFKHTSSHIIALYLDILYAAEKPSSALTIRNLLELLYFASFIEDNSTTVKIQEAFLKGFTSSFSFIEKTWELANELPISTHVIKLLSKVLENENSLTLAIKLKDAADKGDFKAAFEFAYFLNERNVSYDKNLAINYFKKAAEGGVIEAHYQLGLHYSRLDHHAEEMFYHWTQAADLGHIPSQVKLADEYCEFSKFRLAEKYYKMAAASGDPVRQYYLGLFYLNTKNDQKNAAHYLILAAKQGYETAKSDLKVHLKIVQRNNQFYHKIESSTWEYLKNGKSYHLVPIIDPKEG